MNPFSNALLDYHAGDNAATLTISRDDGFRQLVPAAVFFSDAEPHSIEARALSLCKGHVLDIGAAAGRHTLQLIERGIEVTSLEILPEIEVVLRDRGDTNVVISDIFEFTGERFDTLLMLMNGIGMVGTLDGLGRFLRHAHEIASPSGQIICDSIDVSITTDPRHSAYRQNNVTLGRAPGQQKFTIDYSDVTGDSFDWLHIDFVALSEHSSRFDWHAEVVESILASTHRDPA